ncbi:hypothetical protein [Methanobacterium formicicum]|uniref:hypothetical protein n=1 Tax=Methanobacterium formicicum TaxID=2162 RepID=UPI00064EE7F0|nr:hypothetical protein [Methanobacterium formicicum]
METPGTFYLLSKLILNIVIFQTPFLHTNIHLNILKPNLIYKHNPDEMNQPLFENQSLSKSKTNSQAPGL